MTLYKSGTNIPYTLEDYLELTLARIGRIAQKGYKRDKYTFYEHEARIILQELLLEAREVLTTKLDVNDTSRGPNES